MKEHPIQLEHIGLSKIDFIGYRGGSPAEVVGEGQISVNFRYAPYNEVTKTIMLMGEATIGIRLDNPTEHDIQGNPFYLHVTLHGFFSVDDSEFDITYANDFASQNAPVLMYPYLREHVHSLAIRCGYPHVTIPLVEIPRRKSGPHGEVEA